MKTILLTVSLMIVGVACVGQTSGKLRDANSLKVENKVKASAQRLRDSLESDVRHQHTLLQIEFTVDTFKIEERRRLITNLDHSINGMVLSVLDANEKYDELMNKYYQQLQGSLNEKDKKVLSQSQKNWIEFRDSERELNVLLMSDYYSGGGTNQRVFAALRTLDLTRNRVVEFYHYLNRKTE
ncbi:lysozyme inhibitor LprI family protein [Salibacter halophilus]|uniref:DUF1311 domain-containing protein n=1 Tax=Salibacter halophilus TaxID=1803916 RepID=A0A6N6M9T4_9FLAO|nr:lysozyme inhibitor LprI family protein [Salibacter halophilus]KAB1065982.1 DUF1311 domain-containing protein [Salibacter halophilus]